MVAEWDVTPRKIQRKDLNRRIVYGVFGIEVAREGIAKLCEILVSTCHSACRFQRGMTMKKQKARLMKSTGTISNKQSRTNKAGNRRTRYH